MRTARDGEQTLRAIAEKAPDLILLDIMISPPDGYEVCQRVRADPRCKGVKIIMLTARRRDAERERGLGAGADDYVMKPFSTRNLLRRVREILKQT